MLNKIFVLISIGFFFSNSGMAADLGGVVSPYTPILAKRLKLTPPSVKETQLKCFETPGNDLYIGIEQSLRINAPLKQVQEVLEDIDHYSDLFPGYKDVHVLSKKGDLIFTYWEQHVPFPFPNVKYEMIYQVDRSIPDRVVYLYQLNKKSKITASDGFIVIQKEDDLHTQYYELDFFDADWGAAKVMGKKSLWKEAVEGMLHSDLAAKVKAENPEFSHDQARKEAKSLLQAMPATVDQCVDHKGKPDFN